MSITDSVNSPKRITKWIFIGVVVFLVAGWVIYWVPQYQVKLLRERIEATQKIDPTQIQLEKDYVDYANKARTTLAQIIGGLFVLGTIGVALWNAKIAQENAKTAQETLRVTEEGKITERFSKAVELLGNDKLDVRLGGIYALERIARDSQKDHWTVMEILTAFVREKSRKEFWEYYQNLKMKRNLEEAVPVEQILQFKIPTDVQAALTVIGRRNPKWIEQETLQQRLDFSEAVLINGNAVGLTLNKAIFTHANLSKANFKSTELTDTFFYGTTLMDTKFTYANICGAKFWDVKNLNYVDLLHAIRDKNTELPKAIKDILEEHEIEEERFSQELKNGSLDPS